MQDVFFMRDNYLNIDPLFSEKSIKALTYIFQALVYLSPLLLFLYYKYKGQNPRTVINTLDDIENMEKKKYKMSIFKGIGMAILYILFAIRIYWFYQPNNTEISLGILINYLKNNNILDEKFYNILKLYKPENIHTYVKN